MVAKSATGVRTTVYRLVGVESLALCLRAKYHNTDQFRLHDTSVGGRTALMLVGTMVRDRTSWAPRLEAISRVRIDVGNAIAAAALLIEGGQDRAWALTYGMGFQLLEQEYIDPGFGQRIALRTADPESLRSLTRTTLDHRARTDRSSIPAGEQLRGFGVGDFGEVVSRVVSSASIPSLTAGSGPITIRGADSLSLPVAREPASVIDDLDALEAVLSQPALPELEPLEQLTPIKSVSQLRPLEERLRAAIRSDSTDKIALGWPHERIDENGTVTSYKLIGAGKGWSKPHDDVPNLARLQEALESKDSSDPLAAAETIKIQLYRDADGDEPMSGAIPIKKWLAYECEVDSSRYCFHDGRWYLMDTEYASRLHQHVEDIFNRDSGVDLPDWTVDSPDEEAYNEFAAQRLGATLLDRRLIQTKLHRRGIEPCDLLTGDGIPVHVKTLGRSSAASHLIAQALVAVDALRYDEEARQALRARVAAAGTDPELVRGHPSMVVLGLASDRPLSASDLFTFTQVTLARFDAALASAGIRVTVKPILRVR